MTKSCLAAVLCSFLGVLGCETSSQNDYSSPVQVVEVTSRPDVNYGSGSYGSSGYSRPVQPVYQPTPVSSGSGALERLPADSQVSSSSTVVYTAPPPASAPAYSTVPATTTTTTTAGTVVPYSSATTLPPPPPPPPPAVPQGPDTYTVVKGDTLYSIAFRYGLDYRALAQYNGIEPPYNIAVGQVLQLNTKISAAPTYTVKKGDTLYSIAKNHGQSVDFLAGVNNLSAPYILAPGQVLLLSRGAFTTTANSPVSQSLVPVAGEKAHPQTAAPAPAPAPAPAQPTAAAKPPAAAPAPQGTVSTTTVLSDKPVIVSGATRKVGGVTWMWPTKGSVIEGFSTSEQGNKGIDIGGTRGQQVLAAADGQVVYAGNALRGYGNLIIINHANEYLSAYAHNDVLTVTEGQNVKRGQQIARMGSTDAKSVRLHFEIRYRGQSVNPINYLPK